MFRPLRHLPAVLRALQSSQVEGRYPRRARLRARVKPGTINLESALPDLSRDITIIGLGTGSGGSTVRRDPGQSAAAARAGSSTSRVGRWPSRA
jgi:hypothetical protein